MTTYSNIRSTQDTSQDNDDLRYTCRHSVAARELVFALKLREFFRRSTTELLSTMTEHQNNRFTTSFYRILDPWTRHETQQGYLTKVSEEDMTNRVKKHATMSSIHEFTKETATT